MSNVITNEETPNGMALLIIDMINHFQHDDGHQLFENSLPAARAIAELKTKCIDARVPVIYVNDNFHKWHDTFASTVEGVETASAEGAEMVDLLRPQKDDYYVLKPHRSGFYKTPLGLLLHELEVSAVILTGITTDICVLHTGQDAYMRGLRLVVPRDCTAAVRSEYHTQSLDILSRTADAETTISTELSLTGRSERNT